MSSKSSNSSETKNHSSSSVDQQGVSQWLFEMKNASMKGILQEAAGDAIIAFFLWVFVAEGANFAGWVVGVWYSFAFASGLAVALSSEVREAAKMTEREGTRVPVFMGLLFNGFVFCVLIAYGHAPLATLVGANETVRLWNEWQSKEEG